MSDDSGSDSSSESSESSSSSSFGSNTSGYGAGYGPSMSAYSQASSNDSNSNYTTGTGPNYNYNSGQAWTPSLGDRISQGASDNASTIGGIIGALTPIPFGGMIGKGIGSAITKYNNGDQANQITNYHTDGTVSGWVPQNSTSSDDFGNNGSSGSGPNQVYNRPGWGDDYNQVGGSMAGGVNGGLSAPQLTVAEEQAKYAAEAARLNTTLNRPNQVTPYGSQTWAKDPNTDQWTSTTTLTPQQQALQQGQETAAGTSNYLAQDMLDKLKTAGGPQIQTTAGLKSDLKLNPVTATQSVAGVAGAGQGSIDLTGMTALPEVSDATRQRVEQALYEREQSRLDPQWEQRQNDLQAQLANQGITLGSGAFDTSVGQFGRDRNDAYQTALDAAIAGGGTEQSRLFDLALKPRQQEFAERSKAADVSVSNAGFQTQAGIASAANANATAIANANRELEAAKLSNQFALDEGNFNNTAKLNEMNANNGSTTQMMNILSALRQGGQTTTPTFQSGQSGTTVQPVNYAQIANNDQLAQTARDNAKTQESNATKAAVAGLASSVFSSDWFGGLF